MDNIFNETLGELVYNKELSWYEFTVNWCGKDIEITIDVDGEETDSIIDIAVEMVKNQKKWDDIVRKYASEKLTELANDWVRDIYYDNNEENEPPEITEEEFAGRIVLCGISFDDAGGFTFWFTDDDMFLDHSVTVYGDTENGCTDANIEG